MLKSVLEWQISVGHPIQVYCQECYWSTSNRSHRYCAYGHGELTDASLFRTSNEEPKREAINKIEKIPKKVYTECPTLPVATFPAIDPTGTSVLQQCMGCGYQAVEPYPATCPTCRNPYPVSMALGVTWPELLQVATENMQIDTTYQSGEVQLNLFGGVA